MEPKVLSWKPKLYGKTGPIRHDVHDATQDTSALFAGISGDGGARPKLPDVEPPRLGADALLRRIAIQVEGRGKVSTVQGACAARGPSDHRAAGRRNRKVPLPVYARSEEHTSELQS